MGVRDLRQLEKLKRKLEYEEIEHYPFYEPDMDNQITAIASDVMVHLSFLGNRSPLLYSGTGAGTSDGGDWLCTRAVVASIRNCMTQRPC